MKIGKCYTLPVKLENLLMLIDQRATRLWKAIAARPYLVLLFVAIFIYGAVFSYFTVARHNVFESYAWDLGIFNQAMYTALRNAKLFYYTVETYLNPSGSYFAVHFSPILFLLLPLYAINPTPITLLVVQSFALSLGALPLFLLVRKLLKSDKTALTLAIVYLLYPAIHGANWFDFHTPALLPLLFFSLCYFMVTHRWKLYFPSLLLVLMVQEQVAFAVIIIGAYYFLRSGTLRSLPKFSNPSVMDEKVASIITLLICVVYYAFSAYMKSLFPINPEYLERYRALQAYTVAGVRGDPILFPFYLLANPQNAVHALLYDYPLKFFYLIFLFGPLLFVPLRSKLSIGVFALLGLFLFSNYEAYYSIGNQYPLYIAPLIFLATVYGLRNFEHNARLSLLKTVLLVTLLFTANISPLSPISSTFAREGLLWYPTISLTPNENTVSLSNLVGIIPPNASVLTQNTIFPHVSSRINAYVLPPSEVVNDTNYIRSLIDSSEYVLLDPTSYDLNTEFAFNEITRNNLYGVYALGNEALLFKRGFQGEPKFASYGEHRILLAYKDLERASFSRIVNEVASVSEKAVLCTENSAGYFAYGPFIYLLPGLYEVTFTAKVAEHNEGHLGGFDVSSNFGATILSRRDIFGFELPPQKWTNFSLVFTSTRLLSGVEFRAFSRGSTDMYIDRVIMKRVSPNAPSDFGLHTYCCGDLSLASGYASGEGFLVFEQNTTSSTFWYGPYVNLPAGKYRATFVLKATPSSQKTDEHILTLCVSSNFGKDVFGKYEIKGSDLLDKESTSDWREYPIEFIVKNSLEGVEFQGLAPSSNVNLSLAYVIVELVFSPEVN